MSNGKFVLSLDFEIMWGVRDKKNIENYYSDNLKGVHQVIPRLLETFSGYSIKATFSTVGFLFFENKKELLANLPDTIPHYENKMLSPYLNEFEKMGDSYLTDVLHYAPMLIKQIQAHPDQEIGTHTFSHYYCLENGQTIDDFRADIISAKKIAAKWGIDTTSLIFPRNQFNDAYLKVCEENGIICYRGNENSWLYKPRKKETESQFRRALRKMDAYVNLSGHNCYSDEFLKSKTPVDIPSSRLLRPYSPKLKMFEWLRLNRIKTGMTYAAKNNLTFHLWWHPHNFGVHQNENFAFLEKILDHYTFLNKRYQFESHTMTGLTKSLLQTV